MSAHAGQDFNQDDVLGAGVERGAFGGAPRHAAAHEAPEVVAKPKSALKFFLKLGAAMLGVVALVVMGMIFLGSRGSGSDDASFQQASPAAPQPVINTPTPAQAPPPVEMPASSMAAEQPQNDLGLVAAAEVSANAQAVPASQPVDTPQAQPPIQSNDASPIVAKAEVATTQATVAPPAKASEADSEKIARLESTIAALRGDVDRLMTAKNDAARRRDVAARQASRSAPAQRKAAPEPAQPARVAGVVLKAVVDKNAWVQVESGESVMVSPGDRIPGIGVVQSVNPESATVRLSDGRVIK